MLQISNDRMIWYRHYRRPHVWTAILISGLAYFLAAKLSIGLSLPNSPNITPIWIPAPIAWATLYLGGNLLLPGIAIANLLTNLFSLDGQPIEKIIVVSVLQMIFTMGSTVIGTSLLRKYFVGRILDRVRNVVLFSTIALTIPALTPTLSLLGMGIIGVIPWSAYGEIWKTWWIGDSLSIVIGLPMLVSWRRFQWNQIHWNRKTELGILLFGFLLLSGMTYWAEYPLHYLVLPGLIWAAIRLGDRSATLGIVLVTLMTVLATSIGRGPFVRSSLNESLMFLQTFMGSITFTTLLMLAMIAEKQKTQQDLKQSNDNLEQRVRDRTNALESILVELQQAQTQLVQTEKMSSLGQLVAGLAHEINNPISFIHGNINHTRNYTEDLFSIITAYQTEYPQPNPLLDKLIEDLELDYIRKDFPKVIHSMQNGSDRIRQLILTLRNFSRLDEGGLKQVNLHEGLDSTLFVLNYRLTQLSHGMPIKVIKDYGNLPKVECHADELNQVFLHLLNNAIDSLDRDCSNYAHLIRPIIRITTEFQARQTQNDVDQIEVQIWNDGLPIPMNVKAKMFEPFFTTKPIGEGTGLGLTISQRIIVDQHHGSLTYRSESGFGTAFYLRIPVNQSWPSSSDVQTTVRREWHSPETASDAKRESVYLEGQGV